jgi:hypothetical protein
MHNNEINPALASTRIYEFLGESDPNASIDSLTKFEVFLDKLADYKKTFQAIGKVDVFLDALAHVLNDSSAPNKTLLLLATTQGQRVLDALISLKNGADTEKDKADKKKLIRGLYTIYTANLIKERASPVTDDTKKEQQIGCSVIAFAEQMGADAAERTQAIKELVKLGALQNYKLQDRDEQLKGDQLGKYLTGNDWALGVFTDNATNNFRSMFCFQEKSSDFLRAMHGIGLATAAFGSALIISNLFMKEAVYTALINLERNYHSHISRTNGVIFTLYVLSYVCSTLYESISDVYQGTYHSAIKNASASAKDNIMDTETALNNLINEIVGRQR